MKLKRFLRNKRDLKQMHLESASHSLSKALKEERAKKTKLDRPTTTMMENILSNYQISPARYHGGKLNEVDCRAFISKANDTCSEMQVMFLSVNHPQQCSDEIIIYRCNI